jgi:hypothetical protein
MSEVPWLERWWTAVAWTPAGNREMAGLRYQ